MIRVGEFVFFFVFIFFCHLKPGLLFKCTTMPLYAVIFHIVEIIGVIIFLLMYYSRGEGVSRII